MKKVMERLREDKKSLWGKLNSQKDGNATNMSQIVDEKNEEIELLQSEIATLRKTLTEQNKTLRQQNEALHQETDNLRNTVKNLKAAPLSQQNQHSSQRDSERYKSEVSPQDESPRRYPYSDNRQSHTQSGALERGKPSRGQSETGLSPGGYIGEDLSPENHPQKETSAGGYMHRESSPEVHQEGLVPISSSMQRHPSSRSQAQRELESHPQQEVSRLPAELPNRRGESERPDHSSEHSPDLSVTQKTHSVDEGSPIERQHSKASKKERNDTSSASPLEMQMQRIPSVHQPEMEQIEEEKESLRQDSTTMHTEGAEKTRKLEAENAYLQDLVHKLSSRQNEQEPTRQRTSHPRHAASSSRLEPRTASASRSRSPPERGEIVDQVINSTLEKYNLSSVPNKNDLDKIFLKYLGPRSRSTGRLASPKEFDPYSQQRGAEAALLRQSGVGFLSPVISSADRGDLQHTTSRFNR